MGDDRSGDLLNDSRHNAVMVWLVSVGLGALALIHAVSGSYRWFAFTAAAVVIVTVPAVAYRNPTVMPPWKLLGIVALPVVDAAAFDQSPLSAIAVYVAVAAVALVAAVEIHRFTSVRMNHGFAVGLVVITTLAVAAAWNVLLWLSDAALGTSYVVGGRSQEAANYAMMIDFVYATVAGLLAGVVFDRYFRIESGETPTRDEARPAPDGDRTATAPSLLRGRLDVSEGTVRYLSQGMQAGLLGVLVYGAFARSLPTVANAGIALAITFLPAFLQRDRRLPLEPELVFWLTSAVFLHTLGSAGLYDLVGAWDNLTHTLSATIVAAAGYAVVRAIDLHTEEVVLPRKMMFVFILLFVLAFGVVWELMEFVVDQSARLLGVDAVLAQHGVNDTIVDLLFDLVGAVITATWGTVYLTGVSDQLADRFGE